MSEDAAKAGATAEPVPAPEEGEAAANGEEEEELDIDAAAEEEGDLEAEAEADANAGGGNKKPANTGPKDPFAPKPFKTFNTWGKEGFLTEKEQAALTEFIGVVGEDNLTRRKNPHDSVPQFALRWLRARDFKVKAAVLMFQNHLKWIDETGFHGQQFASLDEICGTDEVDKNYIIKNYPCGIKGHDRHGRPLYIKWYGRMAPKNIAKKVDAKHAALWESVIGCLRLPYVFGEASKKHGRHVEEMVAIIDCKGFKLKTFNKYVREVLKHAADTSDPNYPEALGLCIVVNAPWFVKTIWAVAKGFLAKRTRKKFRILGKKFRKVLHTVVDPSNLPVEYGGTGEHGFKTLDELFDYDKAFGVFDTPEYHAAVAADPRNAEYLASASAPAE